MARAGDAITANAAYSAARMFDVALLGVCLWTFACRNPFNEVSVSVDMVTAAVTTALTTRLSTPSMSGPGAGKGASAQASAQVSRDLRRRMRLISTQRWLAASAEAHTNNASLLLPTSSISEGTGFASRDGSGLDGLRSVERVAHNRQLRQFNIHVCLLTLLHLCAAVICWTRHLSRCSSCLAAASASHCCCCCMSC